MVAQQGRLEGGKYLDWLTMGSVSGLWEGMESRTQAMLGDPGVYSIANWLTMGLLNLAEGALNPNKPLSLEHWLSSLGLASAFYGMYEAGKQAIALRKDNTISSGRADADRDDAPLEGGSGTKGYTVNPSMQAKDIEMGVLIDDVYIKNPTAQNMSDLIKPGSNYVGNSKMNGQFMYVVDADENIIIGSRAGKYMPHPTLIGGSNPTVQGAGIIEIRGGKIYCVDNASGHFKPDNSSLTNVQSAFEQLPSNVFHKDFKGYLLFDN